MPAIGLLTLELHIQAAHSLKDKRQVVRSLKDRIRRRFNVSVAEVDHQSSWQLCTVAVVAVSSNKAGVESLLQSAEQAASSLLGADLVDSSIELI
ncbi:MAG: DUF503 domain-containing protein [Bryobacterales bacterium]